MVALRQQGRDALAKARVPQSNLTEKKISELFWRHAARPDPPLRGMQRALAWQIRPSRRREGLQPVSTETARGLPADRTFVERWEG